MTAMATTDQDRATRFASAVRERLSDLPAEELDELLDGLQADLADRLADGGELGDAGAYAEELRQAAGLPPRDEAEAGRRRTFRAALRDGWSGVAERTRVFWDATPARRGIRDFLLSLRPLWWVARGLVLTWALVALPGRGIDLFGLALAAVLIVVSVQWGRGAWAPKRWLVWLRRAASMLAAILLIPALGIAWNALTAPQYSTYEAEPWIPEGLNLNGKQISNIFAYDCGGQPVEVVQLYDQDGEAITTSSEWGAIWGWDEARQENIVYAPNDLAGFAEMWNAFPLNEARMPASSPQDPGALAQQATEAAWPAAERAPMSPSCPAGTDEAGDADETGEASEPVDEGAAEAVTAPREGAAS